MEAEAAGEARRFSSTHFPRTTTDVLSAYEVTVRTPAFPSRPKRSLIRQRHSAKMAAIHIVNAIVDEPAPR